MSATALIRDTGDRRFSNHHRGYTVKLSGHFDCWNATEGELLERYNAMTAALQQWLGRALDARIRVRAYGSGWSISQAPVTEGWMLNTRPIDLYFSVAATAVHPTYPGPAERLMFLQCGNSVTKLNAVLRRAGRSLHATGASNGQTRARFHGHRFRHRLRRDHGRLHILLAGPPHLPGARVPAGAGRQLRGPAGRGAGAR
jgi:hypothetical protein